MCIAGSNRENSLRTRRQIMEWMGLDLPALKYGFELRGNKYRAKFTDNTPAPEELLKTFYCNCKTDCSTKRCSSCNFNLKCTELCGTCGGTKCSNTEYDNMNDSNH